MCIAVVFLPPNAGFGTMVARAELWGVFVRSGEESGSESSVGIAGFLSSSCIFENCAGLPLF